MAVILGLKFGTHSECISFYNTWKATVYHLKKKKKRWGVEIERKRKTTTTISTLLEMLQRSLKTTILSQILP